MPLIVYHNNCADGYGAAWVASNYFNAKGVLCDFLPTNYGEDYSKLPELVKDKEVYVLDFSFKRELMIKLHGLAASFKVLDHHKTAKDDCEGLDFCTFDLAKSGAMLTWEYFYPSLPAPTLIKYIQDRDLWQWKLPYSQEINCVIQSYDKTFNLYDVLAKRVAEEFGSIEPPSNSIIEEGRTILRLEEGHVQSAIKYPINMVIGGHKVLVINNPNLISKSVEALCTDAPFAAAFFLRQDGKWQFSLRSRPPKGIDVSEIAKGYGGGGHPAAAGFELPFDKLGELLGD